MALRVTSNSRKLAKASRLQLDNWGPVPLATPSTDIRIELRRGDHLVTLYWPMAAAAQCLSTLQDWLQ